MRLFRCHCGATIFFDNTSCLNCHRELGYLPDRKTMSALEPGDSSDHFRALAASGETYRKCQNYAQENVCNWMVCADDSPSYCVACRLTKTIPSLENPENRVRWASIEASKRRLVYSLLELGLPLRSKGEDPSKGLAFAFLADPPTASVEAPSDNKVMTGHNQGLITINIAEADQIERELTRRQMHEAYRTLIGHFRHESGHYYWDILLDGAPLQTRFRALFGDERQDYAAALQRHYAEGAPADWQTRFISSYASSHPWEDWAETWAHYLHIVDTLETAKSFGVGSRDGLELIDRQLVDIIDPGASPDSFRGVLRQWVWLSLAINSMNRSMGMRDPYPFVLNRAIVDKLAFVHQVVESAQSAAQ